MRTTTLWKTLNGARFVDPRERVVKASVSSDVARVHFKDGDVETIHLVGYKMPKGEYTGFVAQLALKDLRAYAERIASTVGKRADELEAGGHEGAAAVLSALLDLDLFMLIGWIYGRENNWRITGRPVLRSGNVELEFPVEVDIDSYVCWHGSSACKLRRVAHQDLRREVRNAWLTVATGYWRYALTQFENI